MQRDEFMDEGAGCRGLPVNFPIHRILSREEVFDLLDEDVAAHVADGFS
jgi:hypothetical protein